VDYVYAGKVIILSSICSMLWHYLVTYINDYFLPFSRRSGNRSTEFVASLSNHTFASLGPVHPTSTALTLLCALRRELAQIRVSRLKSISTDYSSCRSKLTTENLNWTITDELRLFRGLNLGSSDYESDVLPTALFRRYQ